jgi:hypothetical protein
MRVTVLSCGFILALSSLGGFAANFLFSIFLDKESFGKIVTLFSVIGVMVLIVPLGTNSYFVTKSDYCRGNTNAIVIFPLAVVALLAVAVLPIYPSLINWSFFLMLATGVLSVQGIFISQLKQDSVRIALYQSMQTFLKVIVSAALLIAFLIKSEFNSIDLMAWALIVSCLCVFPVALLKAIDRIHGGRFFDYQFLIRLKRHQWIELLSFWAVAFFGASYSLGIIPLVAYFHGFTLASYLGIYFIFWSGGNVLITMVINNYFWPKYCLEQSEIFNRRKILIDSLLVSFVISLVTLLGTIIVAVALSGLIWPEFDGLALFLGVASVALFFRGLSAWVGMMILSFNGLVKRKLKVQMLTIILMILYVAFVDINDVFHLGLLLVALEIIYFIGYAICGAVAINRLFLNNSHG